MRMLDAFARAADAGEEELQARHSSTAPHRAAGMSVARLAELIAELRTFMVELDLPAGTYGGPRRVLVEDLIYEAWQRLGQCLEQLEQARDLLVAAYDELDVP
jgi:hypothetical protein